MIIFPSLISADLLNIRSQLHVLDPYCPGYHLDVMDGHFVPNITWGPDFINGIAKETHHLCWIHLMTTNPRTWIDRFILPAQSMIDFHVELSIDHVGLLTHIRSKGYKAGLAIKPDTLLETVFPFTKNLDYILIMSVEPGFSGQQFIATSIDKVNELHRYRFGNQLSFAIAIDGGITTQNIREVAKAGADWCAVASAIFAKPDPLKALENLKKMIHE